MTEAQWEVFTEGANRVARCPTENWVADRVSSLYRHPGGNAACNLTHIFAETGNYASREENGEDMCQILKRDRDRWRTSTRMRLDIYVQYLLE